MDDRGAGVKHLINIFRRLHRIFAHAWFQHRGVFWQVEGQTGLYVLFKTVCDMHELLSPENYKLPPEAEGLESAVEEKAPLVTSIMKGGEGKGGLGATDDFLGVGRNNTRRHIRQSPSVGSAITTVQESDEEDPDVSARLLDLGITTGEGDEDNETEADVPVIVESFEEVDENHDMETNGDGEHESETHELEIGSDVSHPDEDTDTVIQIGSKADSTGSWDRMSGDSLGDKPETEEDGSADDDDDRPVTVIGISKESDSSDTKDGGDAEEEEDDDEKEENPSDEKSSAATESEDLSTTTNTSDDFDTEPSTFLNPETPPEELPEEPSSQVKAHEESPLKDTKNEKGASDDEDDDDDDDDDDEDNDEEEEEEEADEQEVENKEAERKEDETKKA
jgi:hypothetical protein